MRGRTEDVAVEALGHILSTSEAARAALSDVVAAGGERFGPIVRVQTQDTGETGARPDLAGFDESGLDRVLIEAKFAAGLTPNQPVAYLQRLQRLPDGRPTALLFVSPAARVESLWAELRRRASDSRGTLESMRRKDPFEVIDDGAGGLFVPVRLPVGKEYDAVLEEVVGRLQAVARLLDGH